MSNYKIWLSNDYYIPIDEYGYTSGECYEGALGCVIKVVNDDHLELALKLPKLMADTHAENAYVNNTTEEEISGALAINEKPVEDVPLNGIIKTIPNRHPLRNRINLQRNQDETDVQHDGVILVKFERDRPPKFAVAKIKRKDSVVSFYPSGVEKELKKLDLSELETILRTPGEVSKTKFFSLNNDDLESGVNLKKSASYINYLEDELKQDAFQQVWYLGVPSILFPWAYGNLQEFITKNALSSWEIGSHFNMYETFLEGIHVIHSNDMIHGDIRPANFLKPDKYRSDYFVVADYSSFGMEWSALNRGDNLGLTMVGPSIGGERTTPFYSMERRSGKEFESANVAIVLPDTNSNIHYVLLTWRSDVIPDLSTEILSDLEEVSVESDLDSPEDWSVVKGDRLRVRNYIFEIQSKKNTSIGTLYECGPRVGAVMHDRLVVYMDEMLKKQQLSLSNFVEYQQWSASTDVYGLGTVFLYCLYSSKFNPNLAEVKSTMEQSFNDLIGVIDGVPYFNTVFGELTDTVVEIESFYGNNPISQESDIKNDNGNCLYKSAEHATNLILQSTPNARVLLKAFEFNLALFSIFFHFILCCIHRSSHLKTLESNKYERYRPFCETRHDKPSKSGPAAGALKRLREIKGYLNANFFTFFVCTAQEQSRLLPYSPKPDIQLRTERTEIGNFLKDVKINTLQPLFAAVQSQNSARMLGIQNWRIDPGKSLSKAKGNIQRFSKSLAQVLEDTEKIIEKLSDKEYER